MRLICLALAMTLIHTTLARADWEAKKAPLMTRWAKDVTPDKVHPEYPRPQLVRKQWQNLNGLWDYAIKPKDDKQPETFDGQILVPFPVESALSGVMKRVGKDNRLWYRRTFEVPNEWKDQRVLLHFGAVDWDTTILLNGKEVGKHRGGYDPFTLDITDALKRDKPNELVVSVWDPTTDGYQPIGKQHARPNGIWYTPTTGIWQTAWLEPVPKTYIKSLKIEPDVDKSLLRVTATVEGGNDTHRVAVSVSADGSDVQSATGEPGKPIEVKITNPRLWSPDSPFLYSLGVSVAGPDKALDTVQSYAGMRKIALAKDEKGILRLMLNNEFLFQYGPLDQGFWPDGLYTAPTEEALKYDIEVTKKLGFNMARKHVKVEPDRWYYWCDKLGLLVWQDMPSGDKHVRSGRGEITRNEESTKNYEAELKELIDDHYNHPSIVMWVPFNEGWGQFETVRITKWVKQHDPSRLVDCASGWNDYPVGDVIDMHNYPGPGSPKPTAERAAVLGEFGGLGLPLEGHTWQKRGNWGYRSFTDRESLTDAYVGLLERMRPLIGDPGLSAAVYTQTTDVEIEVNGLMTYDREIIKMDEKRIAEAARKLHLPPPTLSVILPTSQEKPADWKYTTSTPGEQWTRVEFDDSSWKTGPAGFGRKETPGAVVRTDWTTSDIYLRRTIELKDTRPSNPMLLIHHDEDTEIYINGELAATLTGYTTDYTTIALTRAGRAALKPGKNLIAIHCKQKTGGQYIDVGLVNLQEVTK